MNIASLRGQRQLARTSDRLASVFERLSSGQRINSASDDPAGLALADSLKTDSRVYSQALRNVNDGISLISIAEAATTELTNIVTRIRELAEQAANGTYTTEQRQILDTESRALVVEYNRILETTEFNGINLLNDNTFSLSIQAGYGNEAVITGEFSLPTMGIQGTGQFEQVNGFVTPHGDRAHGVADVNNDGNMDIVAGSAGNFFSVTLGNADGTFGSSTNYASSNAQTNTLVADMNNDGFADVIATSTLF